ncbi:CapA family protein [Natronorubrum sp. DTA28]|uniref:CapA family protein n=1 Tax=Natronorubrum sp. DTA28 TaxID=3447019 RepID=UPI003F86A90A
MKEKSVSFIGDIAYSSRVSPTIEQSKLPFKNSTVIANLEGDIVEWDGPLHTKNILFNHKSCLDFLLDMGVDLVNLANNHLLDVHPTVKETTYHLKGSGISSIGAGDNIGSAAQVQTFCQGSYEYTVLAFGWNVIGSSPATIKSPGVNPLNPTYVLNMIEYAKEKYMGNELIVLFHWNYNLERHPQPMHRKLAFQAADRGADIIVGHHPHIVSGIEIHKSTPIIYSLGNWFIPHGVFFGGELSYPEISTLQLAVEWSPSVGLLCHWYRYHSEDHSVTYIESDRLSESKRVKELTPYQGMSHDEYTKWFRKNRRVKSLVPVYVEPDQERINKMKDMYCKYRQFAVDKYSSIRK